MPLKRPFDIALTLQLIRKLDLSSQDRRTELEISNIMSRGWEDLSPHRHQSERALLDPLPQLTHLGSAGEGLQRVMS